MVTGLRVPRYYATVLLCCAFRRAACFATTVLALSGRAASPSARPLGVYIYAFGPRSCRIRRVPKGSARLSAPKQAALAPLAVFVARLGASASLPLPAPSLPRPASAICVARLCRRDIASSPCSHLAAQCANRADACRSARHSTPQRASSLNVSPHVDPTAATFAPFLEMCEYNGCKVNDGNGRSAADASERRPYRQRVW